VIPAIFPRLSEAKTVLPLLRAALVAAAPRYAVPAGVALELLPIVEEGVFGYELVPERRAHTYLTIGCRQTGEYILRRTRYRDRIPPAVRLMLVDGNGTVLRERFVPRRSARHRDVRFVDVGDAVESGLAELVALFSGSARKPIRLHTDVHRYLDAALAVAYEHLHDWNPRIRFCGLPNEAQLGYDLADDRGGHGKLLSSRPDMWVLRWKSPRKDVYEEWAVAPHAPDTAAAGAA
jgi:hypothetical protein